MFRSKKIAKGVVLITLLIIPGSVYLLFFGMLKSLPKLGYFGPREAITMLADGKETIDTAYHKVPPFNFTNQNNIQITENQFEGKIYVADFFFTSCQSICPIMSSQLIRVQEKYKELDQVGILSHTVDPESDSAEALRSYADHYQAIDNKWEFITGNKKEI